MGCKRYGSQAPTFQVVGEFARSAGAKLVELFGRYGVRFYGSQKRELELFAARDDGGRFACKTISISKPRQNGKSYACRYYAISMAAKGLHVLYSAHNGGTAHKMYKAIEDFVTDNADFAKRIKRVGGLYRAPGKEGVYFANGGFVEFQTRTNAGTRGSTYDVIIIDEAQELTYDQLDSIKPTTLASDSGDPQMIYVGTPPGPKCPGEVFADQHKAAHEGNSGGAWWLEWSVETVPDLRDRDAVMELAYATNPAMGYRIKDDVMLDAIDSYQNKPDSFAREYLGWWSPVEKANAAIDWGAWTDCAVDAAPESGKMAFAVKFSVDGFFASVAVCCIPSTGTPHVELIDYRNIAVQGLDGLAQFAFERRNRAAVFVIDGKAGSEDLAERLESLGMPRKAYVLTGSREYITAASMLVNSVRERGITHNGDQTLNDCVKTCTKRPIGNNGAFGFGGELPEPVDAVALALWGARTSKRDPNRKAVVW